MCLIARYCEGSDQVRWLRSSLIKMEIIFARESTAHLIDLHYFWVKGYAKRYQAYSDIFLKIKEKHNETTLEFNKFSHEVIKL